MRKLLLGLFITIMTACTQDKGESEVHQFDALSPSSITREWGVSDDVLAQLEEIDWLDMMPPEDLQTMEDLLEQMEAIWATEESDHSGNLTIPVFTGSGTVAGMDGVRGKLPGFVVPISYNDHEQITEFFFVPYFGACLHVPPPPPNQIIYIKPKAPINAGHLWDAFWIVGRLRVAPTENAIAASVYAFDLEGIQKIETWE